MYYIITLKQELNTEHNLLVERSVVDRLLSLVYFLMRIIASVLRYTGYQNFIKDPIQGAFGKFVALSFISGANSQTLSFFGINLKSYLFSMLWHKFYEDVIMQTRKILL